MPTKVEIIAAAILGIMLLLGSIVYARAIKVRAKKIAAYHRFRKQVLGLGIVGGVLLMLISFTQYQAASYLSMRIVGWGLVFIWAVIAFSICSKTARILREASFQAQLQERKLKWLKKAAKKK